ncbi:MAG: ATP-binding cassette domain-containing protein [Herbinix sp.]|nr:ATP-binding cassette domain-containing protein [Herbinix sp.]
MDIKLKHVSKQFGQKIVLKDLNAIFLEGRVNCLMGASGIGKTTAVNIIMGLMEPDSGEVLGRQGKQITAVFQEDRLIEHWNAVKNVKLVCDKGVSEDIIKQELTILGIKDSFDKPVINFSGGMRRRVAIVRAMLAKSDLIILDEPFRGLDEALKMQVIEYIKQRTEGKTVIIVTHDKEDAVQLNANLVMLG